MTLKQGVQEGPSPYLFISPSQTKHTPNKIILLFERGIKGVSEKINTK
jgi:hypothetical protein